MALKSLIEWTDATWNPVTGCTKISPGCKHCYAERLSERLRAMGNPRYRNGFDVTLHPDTLDIPLRWKEPRLIFVNSMSDLFHEKVPYSFIARVFDTMCLASHHVFQILTKRASRLAELAPALPWPSNVWMGVSVESQDYVWRVALLRQVPAAIRFLSLEPLLGPITELNLDGIHWVIVGGESGPNARPMHPEWARRVRDLCQSQHVPFFFKQWGGVHRTARGRLLDGQEWNQMPRGSPLAVSVKGTVARAAT